MSQAFFRNINWDDIYHKRVEPPFKPTINNPKDTSNFDQEFTSVTPVLTPVQSVLTQQMQEEFRGFSYTADFVWVSANVVVAVVMSGNLGFDMIQCMGDTYEEWKNE